MSYHIHPTKGEPHYRIVVESKSLDKNGRMKRKQKLVNFAGTEDEVKSADAKLNDRPADVQYPSVDSVIVRFLEFYKNKTQPTSYDAMLGALKHLLPFYGEMRIPLISNQNHEAYKTIRLDDRYLPGKAWQTPDMDTPEESAKRRPMALSSINRELVCLMSILAWAKTEKIEVTSLPTVFTKKKASGKKIEPLAPSELQKFLKLNTGRNRIAYMLMIFCGLRLLEATALRIENIYISNGTLKVIGKGGDLESVKIPAPLLEPLKQAIGDRTEGLLLANPRTGKPYGNISKALNTLLQKVGVTRHVNHHVLRHSCATALVLANVPIPFVQLQLRHAELSTTMLYVKIAGYFGSTTEADIAREIFWINDNGTQKEVQSGLAKIQELSSLGTMRPDQYPKNPSYIRDIFEGENAN